MEIHSLPRVKHQTKKRLGRGQGSGRGKTSGRGMKGAKARDTIPAAAVGGGLIWFKKLPYVRGHARNGDNRRQPNRKVAISLSQLNIFKPKTEVTVQSLIEVGLLTPGEAGRSVVKVLAEGELTVPLKVALKTSKKAQEMIEKSGGEVVK